MLRQELVTAVHRDAANGHGGFDGRDANPHQGRRRRELLRSLRRLAKQIQRHKAVLLQSKSAAALSNTASPFNGQRSVRLHKEHQRARDVQARLNNLCNRIDAAEVRRASERVETDTLPPMG